MGLLIRSMNFTGDNWKFYFVIGRCPIHGDHFGRGVKEGFMLVRLNDGVPIVKEIYDYDSAVLIAKELASKIETSIEKVLLGSPSLIN